MDELLVEELNKISRIKAQVHDELASTNTFLKELIPGGVGEGSLILARSQSGGRGRRGRSFFSPKDSGIYMSLLLIPKSSTSIELITSAMAVAAARGIKKTLDLEIDLKWVNDLFYKGKKVGGILTEAVFSTSSRPDYIILGMGINLYSPQGGFSQGLNQAGYLLEEKRAGLRNLLIKNIVEEFWPLYDNLADREFLEEYRKRNFLIGKEVLVLEKEPWKARVLGIDENCNLLVVDEGGKPHSLHSGEVSVVASS